jgi:hypothetical protein
VNFVGIAEDFKMDCATHRICNNDGNKTIFKQFFKNKLTIKPKKINKKI